ncbi:MAG: glycosyltransferase family 4 protein [Flavobacteriales bacterium]|nr:glycosyltransferase family 4 protein [Flavobacteriales bacterium]
MSMSSSRQSGRPQVLAFIDWYKPFYKAGGPVRSMVNLVDHLRDRVDFHIVTGDRDYTAGAAPKDLVRDAWTAKDSGERVWHASPKQRTLKQWKALLHEREWDVVYINGLYSKWSTIAPLWILRRSKQRRVVAVRGMLAKGPMKQSAAKKRAFLLAMKTTGCFKGVEFQATNTEEVEDIKRWIGRDVKVHLVPNLGRKASGAAPVAIEKKPGSLRLVSVGRIAPEKNTLFAIERLRDAIGEVRFDLYGTVYDQAYYKRCLEAVAALPPNVTVKWHGHIEQDQVARAIAEAHVVFMPSVGENFGHTMLEALVVGRPLLISDRTPWKDLEAKGAGWDLPLEERERFDRTMDQLISMEQAEYDRICTGASQLAARYLSDSNTVERNYALLSR